MRRLATRILFAALVASGSVLLVIACVRSLQIAEAQTRPGRGGGGGAGGVALQSTSPGLTQTGNSNISGVAIAGRVSGQVGCPNATSGCSTTVSFITPGNVGNGYVFDSSGAYPANAPMVSFRTQGSDSLLLYPTGIQLGGSALLSSYANTIGAANTLNLVARVFNLSGTVSTDTGNAAATGGDLFQWKNQGAIKAHLDYLGNFSANSAALTTPLGQASGGTGAGAVTCTAGQFITSNGTAYSCAAPSSASAYTTYASAATSVAQVAGSNCGVLVITATGAVVGQGCVASYSAPGGNWGTTIPLTLTCDVSSAGSVSFRLCNSGVNAQTPLANTTYYARVFP